MSVSLNFSADPDPAWVLEALEELAEIVRFANHQTLHREALPEPSQAGDALQYLATAMSRLPQLLGQIGAGLEGGRPAGAAAAATDTLARAIPLADALGPLLKTAAKEAHRMRLAGDAG